MVVCFLGCNLALPIFTLQCSSVTSPCLPLLIRTDLAITTTGHCLCDDYSTVRWAAVICLLWSPKKMGEEKLKIGGKLACVEHLGEKLRNSLLGMPQLCGCSNLQMIQERTRKIKENEAMTFHQVQCCFYAENGRHKALLILSVQTRRQKQGQSQTEQRGEKKPLRHQEIFLHLLPPCSPRSLTPGLPWGNAQRYSSILKARSRNQLKNQWHWLPFSVVLFPYRSLLGPFEAVRFW